MKKLSVFLSLLMLVSLISCKRKGCRDPNASNYCESCNATDNSECVDYPVKEAYHIFWYNKIVFDSLTAHGIDTLNISFYDSHAAHNMYYLIYNFKTSYYYSFAPDCQFNQVDRIYSGGYPKHGQTDYTETYSFKCIKNGKPDTTLFPSGIWKSGTIIYHYNTCENTQLTWP
jgi:hypothetical protein